MNTLRRLISLSLLSASLLAAGLSQAADIESRTIKFPSASNKGHPQVVGVEKFAEIVAQKSGGKLAVKAFPGGALGPDLQTVSAMQGGTVEMTVMNASLLAGNVKEMAVFDFPFLINNAREADAVADGPVGQKLLDKLQERGLVGLAYWDLGFRQIHTMKRVIAKADDFKGVKMRVIPTPIYVDFMKALGAAPVPMPFTETYAALEQGAIDGMTNPLLNILDGKFNDVSKHLTLTNHMYTPQAVVVSKKFWDKLSPVEQKILRDAANETAVFQRKFARDEAAKVLSALKTAGMTVHELPPAEIAKLRERAQPVIDKYTRELGPIVTETYAAVEKVRERK
ncbi:TRAP transporter substrate-binding protein [Sphaerotilus mobilis]|uniref:Tripartite ATP-independent transporter DctP family solute receptor n=1 Tax=Sphaerotilus mobilis TaxID=47994 RepID=A0A4Q7LED6_9BURK|nr:TRAP transporter substrate-binding protein [Sphaerotilus mobilis]RZS52303.1 tripartite ATP-independent transporter DctP family solute receptor [Sphaerotilus mobilis]